MNISEFMTQYHISGKIEKIYKRPDGITWGANHWRVTLKCNNRKMTVYFSGGSAVTNIKLADVLDSVASDSAAFDNAQDILDFADEFGYEDRKEARKVYNACGETAEKLKMLLGDAAYKQLLWEVDRL